MSRVGVVGLGAMGSRIAGRLLAVGHDVIVWNRTRAKINLLIERGARAAESPADAAWRAEAVITIVADPHALRDVTQGSAGIAVAPASTTIIQMSTVGPDSVLRLASVLPRGMQLLDAPVLGSTSEAEAGSLRILVGGPSDLVERWMPVLSSLGSIIHLGPLGAGTGAKLVANATLFGVLGLLGEALALADRLGLSREAAFEVLSLTPLAPQAVRRRTSIETGRFPARFSLSLARKDADLIQEAAARVSAELRLGKATRSWLSDAEDAGYGLSDYSGVLARILDPSRMKADSGHSHSGQLKANATQRPLDLRWNRRPDDQAEEVPSLRPLHGPPRGNRQPGGLRDRLRDGAR